MSGMGILSGLLGGLGQAGTSMQAADASARAKRALDITERGQQAEVPLDFIPQALRAQYTPSPSGTVKIDKTLATLYQAMRQKETEANAGQQVGKIFSDVEQASRPTTTPGSELDMPFTTPGTPPNPMEILGRLLKVPGLTAGQSTLAQDYLKQALETSKPMPVPESGMLYDPRQQRFLSAPNTQPSFTPPEGTRPKQTVDKNGRVSTLYEYPEGKGPFQRSDVERVLGEHGWTPDMTGYGTEYANVARQIAVPGVGVYGSGQIAVNAPTSGATPPSSAPAGNGAQPPRLQIGATPAEATSRSEANYSIDELRKLAGSIRTIAPDTASRMSIYLRNTAQGMPLVQAKAMLSPEEQNLATRIGHAQMRYEKALAGVRGAASPQMYDRVKKIFGSLGSATQPDGLEALADSLQNFVGEEQRNETSAGRRPLPGPTSGATPPAPAASGWTVRKKP